MASVIPLNNVTKLNLDPERVLNAVPHDMKGVVVIGYDADGMEYFASSIADGGEVLWLMERLKLQLIDGRFE